MTSLIETHTMTTKPIVIVETDPDNEIDDEIFIHWAMNNISGYSVYFMCVPGAETRDPEKAAIVSNDRVEHIRKLFPRQFAETSTHEANNSYFHICTNNEFIELLRMRNDDSKLNIDYYIKIAPSWHINPWMYGQLHISTRIVMGDLTNPDASINCTKAMHKTDDHILRAEYEAQELIINAANTISIPTHFARQIAFTYDIIMNLPYELQTPIVDKWYKQFVSRPSSKFPWACDISVANLMTIKNMFPRDDARMINIVEKYGVDVVSHERRSDLIIKIDEFLLKAPTMEKHILDEYKLRLLSIAMLVEEITGCYYKDSEFSSNSLNDNELARTNWNKFIYKYKPDATPAYDLLVAVALKEPESFVNVDTCREALKKITS